MASTITAAPPPTHDAGPAVRLQAAAPTTANNERPAERRPTSAAAPSAQQQASLRQLLGRYAYDQSHGVAASTLSGLRRQIFAAAKTLGQNVTLPQASANAATRPPQGQGKISVTA